LIIDWYPHRSALGACARCPRSAAARARIWVLFLTLAIAASIAASVLTVGGSKDLFLNELVPEAFVLDGLCAGRTCIHPTTGKGANGAKSRVRMI